MTLIATALLSKLAPSDPWGSETFWVAVGSLVALLALGFGVVSLFLSSRASRRAAEAQRSAADALTTSAEEARRSADALETANQLFASANARAGWTPTLTSRHRFQLINMTGQVATDVRAADLAENPRGGWGMILGAEGATADPGRGIEFAWSDDDLATPILAIRLSWRSGAAHAPEEAAVYVDRRPTPAQDAQFTAALTDVMSALGRRHHELSEWARTGPSVPTETATGTVFLAAHQRPGGPSDADLQTNVDIAAMQAPAGTTSAMDALLATTFSLKRGRVSWQQVACGEIVGLIRKWRSHEIETNEFRESLRSIEEMAVRQETSFHEEYPSI